MEKKNRLKSTDKVYDAVFWTEINRFTKYIPMLVNEAFGDHFTMNAKVEFLPGKQVVDTNEGKIVKREVDALVKLSEGTDTERTRLYHFEVEVKGKKSIALRIARYVSAHTFSYAREIEGGAEIEIPHTAVIFLRSDSEDIRGFDISIKYPGGRVSYRVPVLRIRDYDLDIIFERKLLLLIPFFVFTITDKEFDEMDRDTSNLKILIDILEEINTRLQEMVERNEIDSAQKGIIKTYIKDVLDKLVEKRDNARKGVEEYMGGYIIETIYDKQQREMDELAQKLAEKNSEFEELSSKNEALSSKNEALSSKNEALSSKNEALLSENATLKSDYESLKAKLEKYEKMGLVIN